MLEVHLDNQQDLIKMLALKLFQFILDVDSGLAKSQ